MDSEGSNKLTKCGCCLVYYYITKALFKNGINTFTQILLSLHIKQLHNVTHCILFSEHLAVTKKAAFSEPGAAVIWIL